MNLPNKKKGLKMDIKEKAWLSRLHFTTGEFADLCGVSKHTLFHYDEKGVFSPDTKAENDYRYYSAEQLEVFHVITVLKELDMPLSQIKTYLDTRTPERFIKLLSEQEARIDEKIKELKKIKRFVKEKSALTKAAIAINPNTFTIEKCSEEWLIITPAASWLLSDEKKIGVLLTQHVRFCESHGVFSPYSISAMLPVSNVESQWYSHFYTRIEKPSAALRNIVHKKPAGDYLTFCHDDGYNTLNESYSKMTDYLREHSLMPTGYFYEDTLLDDLSVHGYNHYMLKLSVAFDPI